MKNRNIKKSALPIKAELTEMDSFEQNKKNVLHEIYRQESDAFFIRKGWK